MMAMPDNRVWICVQAMSLRRSGVVSSWVIPASKPILATPGSLVSWNCVLFFDSSIIANVSLGRISVSVVEAHCVDSKEPTVCEAGIENVD